VNKLSVVFVVAFAFLGERPSPKEWLGLALIAAGVLVLAIRK
jgi:transporter family protein